MCALHLESAPGDPDALALLSRLCLLGGDLAAALAFAAVAVRTHPQHSAAQVALQSALAQRPDPPLALKRFREAVDIEPRATACIECYGSALPFPRIDEVRVLLEEALRLDPALAAAHAALANVLARQNQVLLAIPAYRRALDLDPHQPEAALAVSELLSDVGEEASSDAYRLQALSQKCLYLAEPQQVRVNRSVLVLNAPAPWPQNTPLEFMVDPRAVALHRLYLTGASGDVALPPYDVVFNAIGEAEHAHAALARAADFIAAQDKRVVNHPKHLWKTARPHLAQALSGVFGCTVAPTRRVTRGDLAVWTQFPALVRPIDTHAGRGLERIDEAAAFEPYLARHPDDRFDVTPFVDYRSADGYYRKYRVILVDGVAHPYHLAISPQWMVHYIKTPTASVAWMSAEEERFLRDPRSEFPNWDRTLDAMTHAFGLEYVGIDCTLLRDGSVLVFEADTALLVHCREPADSYKHQYVPRIFRAVEALLARD